MKKLKVCVLLIGISISGGSAFGGEESDIHSASIR
jgi:hypothetical protein